MTFHTGEMPGMAEQVDAGVGNVLIFLWLSHMKYDV